MAEISADEGMTCPSCGIEYEYHPRGKGDEPTGPEHSCEEGKSNSLLCSHGITRLFCTTCRVKPRIEANKGITGEDKWYAEEYVKDEGGLIQELGRTDARTQTWQ